MAQIISTGWVSVSDNQSTNINLSAYTNVESARIRWRGKQQYIQREATTESIQYRNTDAQLNLNTPIVPSGWTFDDLKLVTTVTNKSGEEIPYLLIWAGIDGSIGNFESSYNVPNNSLITVSYVHNSYISQSTHFALSIPAGYITQIDVKAVLGYHTYLYSKSPQVLINTKTTAHPGTLTDGQVSGWYTLSGLKAGQNNTIRHDLLDSTLVDVEIEYTVSMAPSIDTKPASDVSYTSATIAGIVTNEGFDTAHAYFEYGETLAFGTIIDVGEVQEGVAFDYDLTGLDYSKTIYYRAYATNDDGTAYGDTYSFTTLYPTLSAPTIESPVNAVKITDRRPYFIFTLVENANNDATKYHARIRLSEYLNMQSATVFASDESQTGWELWNGATWESFPSGGVDAGSKVRFRPPSNLAFLNYYWDCASNDGTQYGDNSLAYGFRVMLSTDGLYVLAIDSVEYSAYEINVSQASNGQIGKIEISLNNNNGVTNSTINYGDTVNLAVKDVFGNFEEYIGKVRQKQVSGYALKITANLGDSVLSERIIAEDYASQDIGQTVKDIIDDYCSPLSTTNVNTTTGISAPIAAIDKTPLSVLEEIRKQFGIFYYVDKDWDMHFYLSSEISDPHTTIRHGGE